MFSVVDADPYMDGMQIMDEDDQRAGLQFSLVLTLTGIPLNQDLPSSDFGNYWLVLGNEAGLYERGRDPNTNVAFAPPGHSDIKISPVDGQGMALGTLDFSDASTFSSTRRPIDIPAVWTWSAVSINVPNDDLDAAIAAGLTIRLEIAAGKITTDPDKVTPGSTYDSNDNTLLLDDYAGQSSEATMVEFTVISEPSTPGTPGNGGTPTPGNGGNGNGGTPTPGNGGGMPMLGAGEVGSQGHAVLTHMGATSADTGIRGSVQLIEVANMPDLYEFFLNEGTIILNGPAGAVEGDLKITEIMAAKDASLGMRSMYSQWIEVYNTSGATIDFSMGWGLASEEGSVDLLPAAVTAAAGGRVDLVSNADDPGYWAIKSTGGRTLATSDASAIPLISMYRKLKQLNDAGHVDHGKDEGDPERAGTWVASVRPSRNLSGERIGTPGHHPTVRISAADATEPSRTVLINELGNSANDSRDWVELRNTTSGDINLKKWELNLVSADADGMPMEMQLVSFPDNDATKLPAGRVLLIANTSPTDSGNDLAAGIEINKSADDQVKRGVTSLYYVDSNLVLPNDDSKYLLILRNANDKEG